jgi:hypothetical protein
MNKQEALKTFVAEIKARMDGIAAAQRRRPRPDPLPGMQNALSAFIADGAARLMSAGLSVTAIQEAVRAATDPAPDAPRQNGADTGEAPAAPEKNNLNDNDKQGDDDTGDVTGLDLLTTFAAADENLLRDFSEGRLTGRALLDALGRDALVLENTAGALPLVLAECREDGEFDALTSGGEILAGPDGEAFTPQCFEFDADADDPGSVIAEPLVYKDDDEINRICDLIRDIDECTFHERADLGRLAEVCGILPPVDEPAAAIARLWADFESLRAFYAKLRREGKWLVLFAFVRPKLAA